MKKQQSWSKSEDENNNNSIYKYPWEEINLDLGLLAYLGED